ncbi:hypothetical protein [Actinomadura sp. J1-007]|uniref:hypothetical protein n=1 Tax=Actinomadura sp. J1-007 TaxID=2661913 RepID=UPI0019D67E08|nr:hypothetical protein [Actinomadura sp. J1-007]
MPIRRAPAALATALLTAAALATTTATPAGAGATAPADAAALAGATAPVSANAAVFPPLRKHLIASYDFEHPVRGDAARERDLGRSGTVIDLVNGGAAMRVRDGRGTPSSSGSAPRTRRAPTTGRPGSTPRPASGRCAPSGPRAAPPSWAGSR